MIADSFVVTRAAAVTKPVPSAATHAVSGNISAGYEASHTVLPMPVGAPNTAVSFPLTTITSIISCILA